MTKKADSWGTRIGLIFAMAGFAVGFGNFLRFPVQAIQNGGGSFLIPYLVSFVLIGVPMLLVEWAIGRYGGSLGFHSTPFMFQSLDKRRIWKYIGIFGIFTNIIIAAYYSFMESWTLVYALHSLLGTFRGMDQFQVIDFFNRYVTLDQGVFVPYEALFFFVLVIIINTYILSRGLQKGVEMVAKWGVPLLIIFGVILAITAFTIKPGVNGAVNSGLKGLEFLWTPDYSSIWNPKVWLAAAGQIFFTIGVGWGTIQCYASYLKANDDIVLNSMSAGWMNEFVEVVLGAAIIIPISVGYLGIDKVKELAEVGGLAMGFKTMPFLFGQWGGLLSAVGGFLWFGLLFIAGITSSLAMGSPFMSFMQTEYKWSIRKTAITFGLVIFTLGLPSVLFFNQGVLDEFDYWAGTVGLFIFATAEIVLFAWILGMDKGWDEITRNADMRLPIIYKYIIKYITPVLLLIVLGASLIKPTANDWAAAFSQLFNQGHWPLDNSSIIKSVYSAGLRQQLAGLTDAAQIEELQLRIWLADGVKVVLVVVFLIFALLIRKAAKNHTFSNKTNNL